MARLCGAASVVVAGLIEGNFQVISRLENFGSGQLVSFFPGSTFRTAPNMQRLTSIESRPP